MVPQATLTRLLLILAILDAHHAIDCPHVMRGSGHITAHGDIEQVGDASHALHTNDETKRAKRATKRKRRILARCVALAASTSAYSNGKQADEAKTALEAAHYKFIKEFSVKNGNDTDHVGLWSNCWRCVMSFRGSDTNEDFINNFNSTTVSAWGIPGVHAGVKKELEGLVKVMDFSFIRGACTGKIFIVTGRSLGGGLAQLFSLVLNKAGDPLKAGIKADFLYTFGAMSVGSMDLSNDAAQDGCMKGLQFFNAQRNGKNSTVIDTARQPLVGGDVLFPIKSRKMLSFGPWQHRTYKCGTPIPKEVGPFPVMTKQGPNLQGYKDWSANHMIATYALNIGCFSFKQFRKEYVRFEEEWPEKKKKKIEEYKAQMR